MLTELKKRGLQDILIACVDGLKGFPDAINSVYPQTEVQLCVIHQIRNSIKYVASKHHKAFMADLKPVYRAVSKEAAETALGFKIPDVVATSVLWYARRKCELAEQPESYLPLLYETELTDYYMRLAINLKGEKQREQRMREARNSAVPGIDI